MRVPGVRIDGSKSAGTGGDMQCVDPGAEGETGRAYRGAVSVP